MFIQVNLLELASSYLYASSITNLVHTDSAANTTTPFVAYDPSFVTLLGPDASTTLVAQRGYEFVHEAGIYNKPTNSMYIASNADASNENGNLLNVTIVNLTDYSVREQRYDGLSYPNGGCQYNQTHLLWADEGNLTEPSALTLLNPETNVTSRILTSFLGRNFSSLNDAEIHNETGEIWFTDAQYGYFQTFRPPPSIPEQVYRFNPTTGVIQVLADGFVQSNGIEFSPDYSKVYITDTGANTNNMTIPTNPATIYVFDVIDQKYMANRRVFAYVDVGYPDGIHTDVYGNVWSGCGDGVHVWNPDGVLLGKILTPGVVNNFAFVSDGLLLFNGKYLWKTTCAARGRLVAAQFDDNTNIA